LRTGPRDENQWNVTTAEAVKRRGPGGHPHSITKLLVPVDYSEQSQPVLGAAFAFAVPFSAEVTVLHVWETQPQVPATLKCKTPDGRTRLVVDLVREEAQRAMQEFIAAAQIPPGVRLATRIAGGPAAAAIVKEAVQGNFDLIVIGAQGQSAVQRAVLGSVAERVVRTSQIPVLTVPVPSHRPKH
jgi:nucleotide-binding universal stress UspA family protein